MTREEFNSLIEPEKTKRPNDEDWKIIEFVYTFHPSISETRGKEQIAYLYKTFGMRIIKDMIQTAKRAEAMEKELSELRAKYNKLKDDYNALSK